MPVHYRYSPHEEMPHIWGKGLAHFKRMQKLYLLHAHALPPVIPPTAPLGPAPSGSPRSPLPPPHGSASPPPLTCLNIRTPCSRASAISRSAPAYSENAVWSGIGSIIPRESRVRTGNALRRPLGYRVQ